MTARALDLFCCAGGAAMGLHRAGYDVVGVDIRPQRNYPFAFVQADALQPPFDLCYFDLIWASPPCQAFSVASRNNIRAGKIYPNLIPQTRAMLQASGRLWIMENVPGAPLRSDVMLCGSMFGLPLVRHRIFETNFRELIMTPPCQHAEHPVTVCGSGTPSGVRARRTAAGLKDNTSREKREAMGIDWTTREELSQAVPPAYSEFLGRRLMRDLSVGPSNPK